MNILKLVSNGFVTADDGIHFPSDSAPATPDDPDIIVTVTETKAELKLLSSEEATRVGGNMVIAGMLNFAVMAIDVLEKECEKLTQEKDQLKQNVGLVLILVTFIPTLIFFYKPSDLDH